MPALTGSGTTSVQLEAVQEAVPVLVEDMSTLDSIIQDRGRARKVSTRNYRIPMKTSLPGSVAMINLDDNATAFPAGNSTTYDVGTLTPLAFCVPLEMTKLAELAASGGDVSVVNVVNDTIADAAKHLKRFRDVFLQTDGTGNLATVSSVASPGTANCVITLAATPFGARLLALNQTIQIFNGNNVRANAGTGAPIKAIVKTLGSTQTITIDDSAGGGSGVAANDIIRVAGVATGSPVFINGIPVFHSNSTSGTVLGINRTNDYVVSNVVAAGSAQVTQPLLRLSLNQIRQALGDDAVNGLLFHMHPSQAQAYEELGFNMSTYNLADQGGKAGAFDALFSGKHTIDGHVVIENIHADQTRIDLINPKVWGKVKWGNPPFWYELEGQRLFPIYSSGSITAGWRSYLVDAYQSYVDNMKAIGSITGLKVPAGN